MTLIIVLFVALTVGIFKNSYNKKERRKQKMDRNDSPLSPILFAILGLMLGFILMNSLSNSSNPTKESQQIVAEVTDGETYYGVTAIEENYDKAIQLINKTIEENKGEIITEKNEDTTGRDKPLREKTLKIKIPKDNYDKFIKKFKNIEEKDKVFNIKTSQENKTSDKEEKEINIFVEEKIDDEKVLDKLIKITSIIFAIAVVLYAFTIAARKGN